MITTISALYERAETADDFVTIREITDACSADLDEADKAYRETIIRCKNATTEHQKNLAKAEEAYARAVWLEKYAAFMDFHKGR